MPTGMSYFELWLCSDHCGQGINELKSLQRKSLNKGKLEQDSNSFQDFRNVFRFLSFPFIAAIINVTLIDHFGSNVDKFVKILPKY